MKYPEHNTTSKHCWCNPRIEGDIDGELVIIHKPLEQLRERLVALEQESYNADKVIRILQELEII